MYRQNINTQKLVVVIAIALFAIKIWAWYITNSVAILTDALESLINIAAGFFGLYSLYLSSLPKDRNHPYGHGKIEFVSAAIEGTLIFLAGLAIIYHSVDKLQSPHSILNLPQGIGFLSVSAAFNFFLGRYAIRTGKKNNSLALQASGRHLLSDVYTTAGIVLGLGLMYWLKFPWIDSAVAILFSCIILFTGYKLLRQSIAGIMDEADIALLGNLVGLLNQKRQTQWIDLHNLRIIKYGSVLHLDCHLTVPWYFNVVEAHKQVESLETLVKNNFGQSLELFVHTDACVDFSCPICSVEDCKVRKSEFTEKLNWTIENISSNAKHSIS